MSLPEFELSLVSYAIANPRVLKTYSNLKDTHFTYKSAKILWQHLMQLVPVNDWQAPTLLEFRTELKKALTNQKLTEIEQNKFCEDLETVYGTKVTGITGKHLYELYLRAEKKQLEDKIASLDLKDIVKELPSLKKKLELLGQEFRDQEEICFSLFSKEGIRKSVKLVTEMQDGTSTTQTGWPLFDEAMAGGLRKGELNCFLGPTGTGKSLCLFNLAANVYNQGRRVVYFVLDNTLAEFSERLFAAVCGIPIPKKGERLDRAALESRVYQSLPGGIDNDRFLLKVWPPKRKKASDLKFAIEQIKEYCREKDKEAGVRRYRDEDYDADGQLLPYDPENPPVEVWGQIDLICIDYGDLFAPERHNEAPHISLAGSFEEMRSLAVELDVPIFTATQTSKLGAQAEHIQIGHVSNSWDSMMGVANIIGLAQTLAEKLYNEMRWEFLKSRRLDAAGKFMEMLIEPRLQRIIQKPGFVRLLPIVSGGEAGKTPEEKREEEQTVEIIHNQLTEFDGRQHLIRSDSFAKAKKALEEGNVLVSMHDSLQDSLLSNELELALAGRPREVYSNGVCNNEENNNDLDV